MQVSGVGASMTTSAGVTGSTGAADAAAGTTSLTLSTPMTGAESLAQSLQDFSIAEILIALLLMAAAGKSDDDSEGSSAALGFLAGMAMAGQLNASMDISLQGPAGSFAMEIPAGTQLNIIA